MAVSFSEQSPNDASKAASNSPSAAHSDQSGEHRGLNEVFRHFSNRTSELMGSSWAFLIAVAVILVWGVTGPIFKFSDTWQLIINTGTTIVTFLMVFLIQNTQNRDAKAFHLKLDELIRAHSGARNRLIDLEDCTDEELKQLQEAFQRLRHEAPEASEEIEELGEALSEEQCEREQEEKARAVVAPRK